MSRNGDDPGPEGPPEDPAFRARVEAELRAQIAEDEARDARKRSLVWMTDAPDVMPVRSGPVANGSDHPVVLRHAAEIVAEQREPDWLLDDVIERKVLAIVFGARASFKSFVALDWALRIAAKGEPVIILSGEGLGLDRRIDAWMRVHGTGLDLAKLPLYCLERAIHLNQEQPMLHLRAAIERIEVRPALIVIDTLSKFAGGAEENANTDMAVFLSQLSQHLREALGCTVLLVGHTGHGNQERMRGAYVLMANPDAEYLVSRPAEAMTCSVTRQRFKDTPSLPDMGYEARVVDLGREDKRGQPVTSLVLHGGEAIATVSAPKEPRGPAVQSILRALRAQAADHAKTHPGTPLVWTLDEMRAVGRHLGLHRNTARDAVDRLILSGLTTRSLGGSYLTETVKDLP